MRSPVQSKSVSAPVDKRRHAPAMSPVSSPVQGHFEQALTRAAEDDGKDKRDTASPESATPIVWPPATALQPHSHAPLNHAPTTAAPQASPTAQALNTHLQQPAIQAMPGQPQQLSVELTDPHLPLASIDVQRIGTRVDVALLGHPTTRTDISPMALGRLRERLAARGADLGALTWTSHHHDEDEHDEH